MRLTAFTDYCLRVMMYSALAGERLVTINEIAHAYNISASHLTKVVFFLGQHGYLITVRGKGGGVRLTEDPRQINLGKLVRAAEADNVMVECFDPEHSRCRITPWCRLMDVLHSAQEAFYGELSLHTLADLLVQRTGLGQALGIEIREIKQESP
ncbi:RrF2 family transcriptional regulator [Paludibacterium denitrificans]|uniref:Rrf2 family transcriptional regulator n=1 Tax=Paludibacterium denitrificans TaxID=2675226 RepID=A0A844GG17_9NEIS|nr:Rrf2 family transcriptional regulator [Paludibacterium denitrificans]MTD34221.1 Rrf2 family transcriptional regulator [Paludibacterium denitrificans]